MTDTDHRTAYQQLREDLGLTQAQFAAEIGVSHQRISQIESWQGCLRPKTLKDMCARYDARIRNLGLSVADFLEERWF
jgi:DNA-binding XRE family transcriptional regulator